MEQFLIEIPHAEQNCLDLIKVLPAHGDLNNVEYGCQNGVHKGWAVVTAESELEARLVVPPLMRRKARVIKLAKFDATTSAQVEKNGETFPSTAMLRMYEAFPCWW